MKKMLLVIPALTLAAILAFTGTLYAQAEKVKEKAKDLKKKVEGKPAPTNAPPQKPKSR